MGEIAGRAAKVDVVAMPPLMAVIVCAEYEYTGAEKNPEKLKINDNEHKHRKIMFEK